jgi:hypothetical protein
MSNPETELVSTTTPSTKVALVDIEAQALDVDDDDPDTKKKKVFERTLWTRVWQGIAIACFVLNIVSMAIEGSAVAIIAGLIALLVAGAVFKFQFDLQDTDSKSYIG